MSGTLEGFLSQQTPNLLGLGMSLRNDRLNRDESKYQFDATMGEEKRQFDTNVGLKKTAQEEVTAARISADELQRMAQESIDRVNRAEAYYKESLGTVNEAKAARELAEIKREEQATARTISQEDARHARQAWMNDKGRMGQEYYGSDDQLRTLNQFTKQNSTGLQLLWSKGVGVKGQEIIVQRDQDGNFVFSGPNGENPKVIDPLQADRIFDAETMKIGGMDGVGQIGASSRLADDGAQTTAINMGIANGMTGGVQPQPSLGAARRAPLTAEEAEPASKGLYADTGSALSDKASQIERDRIPAGELRTLKLARGIKETDDRRLQKSGWIGSMVNSVYDVLDIGAGGLDSPEDVIDWTRDVWEANDLQKEFGVQDIDDLRNAKGQKVLERILQRRVRNSTFKGLGSNKLTAKEMSEIRRAIGTEAPNFREKKWSPAEIERITKFETRGF